jgi:hypothetical protein
MKEGLAETQGLPRLARNACKINDLAEVVCSC